MITTALVNNKWGIHLNVYNVDYQIMSECRDTTHERDLMRSNLLGLISWSVLYLH